MMRLIQHVQDSKKEAVGRGAGSLCQANCPSRRGLRRRDVVDDLVRGHIDPGVHPRSRLVAEAQARLTLRAQQDAAEVGDLQGLIAELEERLHVLEQRRADMVNRLTALMHYHANGYDPQHHRSPSQPESEP